MGGKAEFRTFWPYKMTNSIKSIFGQLISTILGKLELKIEKNFWPVTEKLHIKKKEEKSYSEAFLRLALT